MKAFTIILISIFISPLIAHSEDISLMCTSGSGWDRAHCYEDKLKIENDGMATVLTVIRDDFVSQDLANSILSVQEKWNTYVEAECRQQVTLRGSSGAMLLNRCLYLKTKARAEELRIHACTENGCPQRKSEQR